MLKNISRIECKINNKDHFYMCDMDCTTGEVKEALFQFQKFVGALEDQQKAVQDKAKEESEVKPEIIEAIPDPA